VQDCIRPPRRSADAADEAREDGGGRKKGCSVRGKVEETLTCRPAEIERNSNV